MGGDVIAEACNDCLIVACYLSVSLGGGLRSRLHVVCTEMSIQGDKESAEKLCTIVSKEIRRYTIWNYPRVKEYICHGVWGTSCSRQCSFQFWVPTSNIPTMLVALYRLGQRNKAIYCEELLRSLCWKELKVAFVPEFGAIFGKTVVVAHGFVHIVCPCRSVIFSSHCFTHTTLSRVPAKRRLV